MNETYRTLNVLSNVVARGLTSESPSIEEAIPEITVDLYPHQRTVLKAMEEYETVLTKGQMSVSGELLYANYGILGDTVGIGKSLMVLAHIARLKRGEPITSTKQVGSTSAKSMFSIQENIFSGEKEANSLLVVPHTLFRQWSNYITKQTTLKTLFVDKKKMLTEEGLETKILEADIVLVSNTLYREFAAWIDYKEISWRRFYLDEADSIHITSTSHYPRTRFSWFITASWMNLIFSGSVVHISNLVLQQNVLQRDAIFSNIRDLIQGMSLDSRGTYSYIRNTVVSPGFLRTAINMYHKARGHLILLCDKRYVAESISLPPVYTRTILCRAPILQRIVQSVISQDVRDRLNGGDVAGALEALGVQAEEPKKLVEAVTEKLKKDLHVVEATYAFKASLEYSTAAAKEAALLSLEQKKKSIQEQIRSLEERIEGFKEELCPICYSDVEQPLLSPCCSRVFCGGCIVQWLDRKCSCPMCRMDLRPGQMKKLVSQEEKNAIVESGCAAAGGQGPQEPLLEKKSEALLRLFRENPEGRFLIFSRYDSPFTAIERELQEMNWPVKILKGNKNAIQASLNQFQKGEVRCLLLNSSFAGAGLTITAATHVVLFHAMTYEEEKQVVGRACRMGRTEPLHCVKLLHEEERTT